MLEGRVCVVTGGGSGIGRAIAIAMADAGAKVVVLDADLTGAEETCHLVAGAGGRALALACNVADQSAVEASRDVVHAQFGDADVLVNNAGIVRHGGIGELSLRDWNDMLSVNLTGYFLCAKTFGAAMRAKGGGALIHISSVSADYVTPYMGAYSVTKAGIVMLSRQLSVEWGPDGVRSNAVLPGLVKTPLSQAAYEREGAEEVRARSVPAGRIGQPGDVAQAVLFLASPQAAYINGAELVVDGGFSRNFMTLIPRFE